MADEASERAREGKKELAVRACVAETSLESPSCCVEVAGGGGGGDVAF